MSLQLNIHLHHKANHFLYQEEAEFFIEKMLLLIMKIQISNGTIYSEKSTIFLLQMVG